MYLLGTIEYSYDYLNNFFFKLLILLFKYMIKNEYKYFIF